MEKTIYDLLGEMSDVDAEFSENAMVFIQRPVTLSSPARITNFEQPEGGWVYPEDGGIHDGKSLLATVSYIQSFMYSDWTMEDVFYEVRERRCNIFRGE